MARAAFLFTGCSHVVATSETGAGWVVACGDRIAYGNAYGTGPAGVAEAEAFAAVEGARDALDRFPDAGRLLLTTDGHEMQFAPWGNLAGGMDPDVDATGLLALCGARGVSHAVRWWPGHKAGPEPADIALTLARGLAIHGRRGNARRGCVDAGPGWRSRLVAAIGRPVANHGLKSAGLTPGEAAALTGLDVPAVTERVGDGRLGLSPRGGITLASALSERDAAERAGLVSWGGEEFGDGHLASVERPADTILHVAMKLFGSACAIGIARGRRDGYEVFSERIAVRSSREAGNAAMAAGLQVISRLVDEGGKGRVIDVVTTDPWLASVLAGRPAASPEVSAGQAALSGMAAARGIRIRPRLVKDELLRRWNGNEPLGLMAAAVHAANLGVMGNPRALRAESLRGSADALLERLDTEDTAARDAMRHRGQDAVTRALFGLVPDEGAARDRFARLAAEVHASYRGSALVTRAVLPGRVEGRIGTVGVDGARPCGEPFAIGPALSAGWDAWWKDYDAILARNPVLALREALLRLDAAPDLSAWPRARHRSILLWLDGLEPCPFRIPPDRIAPARGELAGLVAACGGWPFMDGAAAIHAAA